MKRRLFTILSALSLLLCVAVVVLWVRSYFVNDGLYWYVDYEAALLVSEGGILEFAHSNRDPTTEGPPMQFQGLGRESLRNFGDGDPTDPGIRHNWRLFGFWWYVTDGGSTNSNGYLYPSIRYIDVPHWFLVLALFILPLSWVVTHVKRRRQDGLCPSCGYDLRATPEGCPECGHVVVSVGTNPMKRRSVS